MNEGFIIGKIANKTLKFLPVNSQKPTVMQFMLVFAKQTLDGKTEYNYFPAKLFGENKIANVLKNGITEGDTISLVYCLQNEKYTTKEGENRYSYILSIKEIYPIKASKVDTSKNSVPKTNNNNSNNYYNNQNNTYQNNTSESYNNNIDIKDDDLPF